MPGSLMHVDSLTDSLTPTFTFTFLCTDQGQLPWEAPLQIAAHANRDEEGRYSAAWK